MASTDTPSMVGYARVSTDRQDLEAQRQRLNEAGTIKTFEDVVSGKKFDRPGLAALLDYVRPGDMVCVVRLDRMGRDLKELLEIVATLKERGVGFASLTEKLDTTGAAGELIFHVFGAIAQFERSLNAERTKDGLQAARAKGRRIGRPPLDQEKLDTALRLVDSGIAPGEAAKRAGLGKSTVYREMKKRAA